MAAMSTFLLTSCGSYQYAGTSNDGIYGDTEQVQVVVPTEVEYGTREENGDYYKRMFEEEAALYGEVLAENAVFTDVDSYSSTGNYDYDNENSNYQGGNAPWGNDPDSYSINIYNDRFFGSYNPFWDYWGPAYYGAGFWPGHYAMGFWGSPWGRYGTGFGFGYGNAFGFGFGVHPFIYGGFGYHNPYNFYGNRYNNYRNNVAYNTGRRNSVSNFRNNRVENLRNATSLGDRGRSSSYSRSIRNLRNSNDDYGISRRTYSRDYQTRSNTNSPYSTNRSGTINRSNRGSDAYSRSSNNTRNSGTVRRSSSPTRSSGTVRSSSSTRSSGTVRSSGSTSRSSGTRSSGGSSSRGRGN